MHVTKSPNHYPNFRKRLVEQVIKYSKTLRILKKKRLLRRLQLAESIIDTYRSRLLSFQQLC